MSGTLTLYTNPMSRGRIAHWMMEELGQPYEVEYLDFGEPMKSRLAEVGNPMGKVPTLRHGDVVVTEAAAICAYVAAAFPDAGLQPAAGSPAHADYLRWMFFAAGPLEAAVTAKSLGLLAPADKSGMAGYGTFEDVVAALEQAVDGRQFIAGDRFSAADVYVGSQIGWGLMFGSLPPSPAFQRYHDGLKDRPALHRASAENDARIPKQG